MNYNSTFKIQHSKFLKFKTQTLIWASQFNVCCYLDNNSYTAYPYRSYECLVAADVIDELNPPQSPFIKGDLGGFNSFQALRSFYNSKKDWLFGFFSYDLKNELEKLFSNNFDGIQFPAIHFFQPRYVINIQKDKVSISTSEDNAEEIFNEIGSINVQCSMFNVQCSIHNRVSKNQYLKRVNQIQNHILEGDIYELNYCQEFYAENTLIDPLSVFVHLNKISGAPFSCYYQLQDKYLLCASPERFIKKRIDKLISQPIKGTIKKGKDKTEDERLKKQLQNDLKERAENVMIVDLVRNDLAKSSITGSIKVEELFKIYTFPLVNQMVSTISSQLDPNIHFIDAIKNAFPMGSMTGTPKIAAMELIEHYEKTKRGLYSGAVGYIAPNGDFDFNVVIRSILYNEKNKYISFQVGGAITYDAIAEKEYEECSLKAKGMINVLIGK